ncbi:hypothetical protein RF11_10017 [Thelohanellus kitauei]|uniref:PCI domain-containing protein n=1 Tax=Thelohanellus kitauei TaxID=669202 RepID=A0A0C2NE75_THEKT|nr:hypothetical protein RF11_10017 [Thelohanellus kitauei]
MKLVYMYLLIDQTKELQEFILTSKYERFNLSRHPIQKYERSLARSEHMGFIYLMTLLTCVDIMHVMAIYRQLQKIENQLQFDMGLFDLFSSLALYDFRKFFVSLKRIIPRIYNDFFLRQIGDSMVDAIISNSLCQALTPYKTVYIDTFSELVGLNRQEIKNFIEMSKKKHDYALDEISGVIYRTNSSMDITMKELVTSQTPNMLS